MKRPKRLDPPADLSPSPPVPKPEEANSAEPPEDQKGKLDPTRYGDWEKRGIAIDF
jgi:hypothetical protein